MSHRCICSLMMLCHCRVMVWVRMKVKWSTFRFPSVSPTTTNVSWSYNCQFLCGSAHCFITPVRYAGFLHNVLEGKTMGKGTCGGGKNRIVT